MRRILNKIRRFWRDGIHSENRVPFCVIGGMIVILALYMIARVL